MLPVEDHDDKMVQSSETSKNKTVYNRFLDGPLIKMQRDDLLAHTAGFLGNILIETASLLN